jgi:hypothetical protein
VGPGGGGQDRGPHPPADGKPGLALCAHDDDFDPLQAAREAGVEDPELQVEPD